MFCLSLSLSLQPTIVAGDAAFVTVVDVLVLVLVVVVFVIVIPANGLVVVVIVIVIVGDVLVLVVVIVIALYFILSLHNMDFGLCVLESQLVHNEMLGSHTETFRPPKTLELLKSLSQSVDQTHMGSEVKLVPAYKVTMRPCSESSPLVWLVSQHRDVKVVGLMHRASTR